jgi:hypothetical protein
MAGQGHKKAFAEKAHNKRASKYEDWAALHLDQITEWAAEGLSLPDMARAMHVKPATVRAWYKRHAEFRLAVIDGRDEAIDEIESSLIKRAKGYDVDQVEKTEFADPDGNPTQIITKTITKHQPGDVKAVEFFLKNRDKERWANTVDVNITGGVLMVPQGDVSDWAQSVSKQQEELAESAEERAKEILGDDETEDE